VKAAILELNAVFGRPDIISERPDGRAWGGEAWFKREEWHIEGEGENGRAVAGLRLARLVRARHHQRSPSRPRRLVHRRHRHGVMKAGAQIYADECSGCHTSDGKGVPGLFPALSGAAVVQQTDPTTLLHVVLRGALSVGTDRAPTAAAMPAFGWILKDDQVAAVVTYIRNAWGNAAPPVSAGDVGKTREDLVERSD
jgi:mono/diheme cytochrome c family protein